MDSRLMGFNEESFRVVIAGVGQVDIRRDLRTADGKPRVRVDVISDFDRFGPAPDGLRYVVENGDPGPGVVFITGYAPHPEPVPDIEMIEREYQYQKEQEQEQEQEQP